MSTIYYYPHHPNRDIEEDALFDLMYDLEPINPPHTSYKSDMTSCPAMSVNQSHTYLIRSPIDFSISYNQQQRKWASTKEVSDEVSQMFILHQDRNPYFQLGVYYLFWSEKKSNTQLWQHDVPLHEVNEIPSWYTATGMFPVGEYVRTTACGMILKPDHTKIKVTRGQPIAAITLVGDTKIKLVKKQPSQEIIDMNYRNLTKPKYCPYLAAKTLFSRWL